MREIPIFLTLPLRPLPMWPLTALLSRLAHRILASHPGILKRIDINQSKKFLLDITDLPFCLTLQPQPARIEAWRRGAAPHGDARISGPLAAFLAMVHGIEDGDTLFFSGALRIDGDTSAVLALRNALDDAELDLSAEIAALMPPLKGALHAGVPPIERLTGLSLRRADAIDEVY